jgi:hypothetical protein
MELTQEEQLDLLELRIKEMNKKLDEMIKHISEKDPEGWKRAQENSK